MPSELFLVLDGNALLHRAWHAIPMLSTADGTIVNAAYGFTNIVENMLEKYHPQYMAVVWDLPGKTFRHEAFVEYKAQREKKADELYAQIPMIQEILTAYGIPSWSVAGFEGDDLLGTISAFNEKKDMATLIVTGDLDALQLVSEKTTVAIFLKGLSEVKEYDVRAVEERYGLHPRQLIDLKTLLGDTSDNLPGVSGIGQKSALELLQTYGSVERMMLALHDGLLPEKYAKKFAGQEKTVELMRIMVSIVRDVAMPDFSYEAAKVHSPAAEKLVPILAKYEFKKLLKKYGAVRGVGSREQGTGSRGRDLKTIGLGELDLTQIAVRVVEGQQDMFGVSGVVEVHDGKQCAMVMFNDDRMVEELRAILERAVAVVAYDWKKILHLFSSELFCKNIFDVTLAAYIVGDPEIDSLLEHMSKTEDLFALEVKLRRSLKRDSLEKVYFDIELPLAKVLWRMEKTGILVDKAKLAGLSKDFEATLSKLTTKIYALAGKEFNINSPAQLAQVLFDDLHISSKGIKKTKTGLSTAAPELEKIWDAHEIVPLIDEYREIAKLKNTYADSLPLAIAEDGRIHSTFSQTIAATGRLSSINPNLQNIPIRSELGREIRNAFIAPPDYVLLSADYSQIELRLAAHLAHDEAFLRAFAEGVDIHTRTAAEICGVDESAVTKDQRAAAKAINFSVLYGAGPRNLARSTGYSFEDAKRFLDTYFDVHSGIAEYIAAMKLKAHKDGYVETLFGRRRYLPDINSHIPQLVAAAERMAMNMPMQGTQADLVKMAMIAVDAWLKKGEVRARMLLQVHDELVFEVHKEDAEELGDKVKELMVGVVRLDVPLIVDVETADRWGQM
jgi:DNA polymerase-1